MATYVNDLRLKEIATGDEAGTWGASTNTNLELIAEAFSYGTEASFGSDADATTTIADGSTDPARSLYLKVTSGASLTATRTLTIAPNTVSKVWIIENATSGSQSINISQGSGANVTIPSGKTKIVYSDGAGSGAAVVDALASLNLETSGIIETSSSIQTPLIEYTDGDDAMTIADGGQVTFAQNIIGTLDTAAQPNITSVGTLTGLDVAGTPTFDGLTVDGDATLSSGSSSNLTLSMYAPDTGYNSSIFLGRTATRKAIIEAEQVDANSGHNLNFYTNANGSDATKRATISKDGDISFYDDTGTSQALYWDASAESLGIGTTSPDADLHVYDSDGDCNLILETGTNNSQLGFGDSADNFVGKIQYNHPSNFMAFNTNGSEALRIDSSGNVAIGDTSSRGFRLYLENAGSSGAGQLMLVDSDNSGLQREIRTDAGVLSFDYWDGSNRSNHLTIAANGKVGIGVSSPQARLHVSGVAPTYTNTSTVFYGGTTNNGTMNGVSLWSSGDALNGGISSNLLFDNGTVSQTNTGRSSGNIYFGNTTTASKTSDMIFGGYVKGSTTFVERMRVDGDGNLLVGTTDITLYNDSSDEYGIVFEPTGESQFSANNRTLMYLNRQNGDGAIVDFRKDGSPVGSIGSSSPALYIGSGDVGVRFDGGNDRIRPVGNASNLEAVRDNAIDLGDSGARFKDLYLSGGAYLGGTGSANKLDDYEEGTWTPTLLNLGTGTYNVRVGTYTKIGNLVTVQCHIDIASLGTGTGDIRVSGFPFAALNVTYNYGVSSSIHGTSWTTQRGSLNLLLGPNTTTTNVMYYDMANTSATTVSHADMGTGNLLFSMTYRTE